MSSSNFANTILGDAVNKAVKAGIDLAKALGAKVTGYYAVEEIHARVYGEGYMIDKKMIEELDRRAKEVGENHLEEVRKVAKAAGVEFNGIVEHADTPYRGIVDAAKKQKCDAIFMASHGRGGIAGLILGSVTHKVLTHSKIPVMVYR